MSDYDITLSDLAKRTRLGYVAVWHGGSGYSSYGMEESGEYFATLEDAQCEYEQRYHGSSITRRVQFTEQDEIHGVLQAEELRTPGVDETHTMDLYHVVPTTDGGYMYASEPFMRFVRGPRGGTRRERY